MVGGKKVGKSTIIANNLKMSGDKCTVLYEDDDGNKGMYEIHTVVIATDLFSVQYYRTPADLP